MEVTQYKDFVIPSLIRKYAPFVQELESSMIEFPTIMPKSSIVFPDYPTSERRMFMALYEKYIDNGAEWKCKLSEESTDEATILYRRCKLDQGRKITQRQMNLDFDDDGNVIPNGNSKDKINNGAIKTMRGGTVENYIEMSDTSAASASNSGRLRGNSTVAKVPTRDLKSMVEALDGALDDAIEILKKSFKKYKMTPVS